MRKITIITGPQGSGKSTLASLIKVGIEEDVVENPSVKIIEVPEDCSVDMLIQYVHRNPKQHYIVCLQTEYIKYRGLTSKGNELDLIDKLIKAFPCKIQEINLMLWN